ncbi:MAG: hypothetical protein HeimC3_12200 [Candidatus Heimdallarchaeota archaeon LC_3]|nr:MAG: hypothetical protein HeimC3_12200 [Candidatus Heimdallarchaeota archaeon LC_3]
MRLKLLYNNVLDQREKQLSGGVIDQFKRVEAIISNLEKNY